MSGSMELQESLVKAGESGSSLSNQVIVQEARSPVDHSHGQGEEALKDVVCGSIAGVVGKYIEYPFDTIKVRLQSQPNHLPLQYTGPLDCFKKSLKQDGFIGIYRGISAPLIGAAVETSCLFFSYRLAGDAVRAAGFCQSEQDLPYPAMLGCGMAAGAFTSLFLTPIELVKCKMQVPLRTTGPTIVRPGILGVIGSIYRHQGFMGYWHGQTGTFIRETGGGAAWFGGYEGVKLLFKKVNQKSGPISDDYLPVYQRMVAGSIAGMAYNFLFYPADTIKSRMQTEDVQRLTGGKSTFSAVAKALWSQHGLKGMYRGCGITVGRSIPSSAFIFTVYEELKKRWPDRRAEPRHTESWLYDSRSYAAMDRLHALEVAAEKIVLDPKYHDVLTLVKGIRNGIVYGTKVRFPHALVMIFLFRSGSLRSKAWLVFKATRQHARNLGLFALVYKSSMLFLRHTSPTGKERHYDAFLAGLLGGYTVFGRTIHNSVSQQIVIYVFARVCLALAKLTVQPKGVGKIEGGGGGWGLLGEGEARHRIVKNGWPAFASLSWAMVMYLFRWHPETVQSSLRSSMSYIYVQSDDWDSLRTLLWHNK
ncbi:mitochondrial carrier [Lentithecium fluviatile CBS 122367]|uniref:Mitochondrial carrier n=1 Tax=Lentithecium fluviatile CBS 122367 TaxID=1168545 RepID=A0A6G1IWP0_9PLEO|nr:mitochondrial carrier [Lentithecium fluviatile CBS 122367]